MKALQPPGWPRPKGYANGLEAKGLVFVAGQIGWDETGTFPSATLAGQFRQTLLNTLAILREAGAGADDIVRMTWYITNREEYLTAQGELGAIWKELMGRHYPAMAVVIVAGLIEREAKIEIETTAIVGASKGAP
ncbi:MAG: RidA family protein [Alphaproteobacteria bacterium]